jgi:CRISPR system Cascade subunit CasE
MYMTRVMLRHVPPPNIIHGVLSVAFPGKRNDKTNENLWRVDNFGEDCALIIVSVLRPRLQPIINEIGRSDERNRTLNYEPFLQRIQIDRNLSFRLCANPVENKRKNHNDKRGKIYALRTAPEQFNWLDKQGMKHGFEVTSCCIIGDEWKFFKEKDRKGSLNTVCVRAITFDGSLTVIDAEKFRAVLSRGLGRSKAYGCGLLTVANTQEYQS